MASDIKLIVYPISDVEKAKAFYRTFLGIDPYMDSAHYIGFRDGDYEVGLDPNSTVGPIAYTFVDDIERSLHEMAEAGAEIVQEAKDVGGGLLIAQVKDSDGNVVGFRQQPK